jgi:hypothetical protein
MRTINTDPNHSARAMNWEHFGHFERLDVQNQVMENDLILFQRNLFSEPYFSAVEYFQGLGRPVVLDLDDAYPILPWSNPAHSFWIQNARKLDPEPLKGLQNGVEIVDAVSSPSKVICQDWSHLNTPIWIPNFPQGSWYEDLPGKDDKFKDRIIIGWGGSVSHYDSFWLSGVRQALESICNRRPEVIFKFCGNDGRVYLQLPVGMRNKMWQKGVPPDQWPKIISTFDIGLAPLDLLGPYDARRSWIKCIEYQLAKVPWVASDGPPYADLRQYGHVVGNTPQEWEETLEYMIQNIEAERERAAGEPYDWVQTVTMERNVGFYAQLGQKMSGLRAASIGLPGLMHVGIERQQRPVKELEGIIRVEAA